jgi:hypothetical protein
MIASEKKLPSVKIYNVAARVPGRWNRNEIVIQLDRLLSFKNLFHTKPARTVVRVHDASTLKSLSEQLVICNVVFVRK